jgi:putative protease
MTSASERLTSDYAAPGHGIELLAPAGDWDCVRAAVENGADAVYFGLERGFNARARAHNFSLDELPDVVAFLHHRGVRGYVTFNTLVFSGELPEAEDLIRRIAAAGTDAVLVQDLGVVRLIRAICPDLAIHASTQMTLTSSECIQVAQMLGAERVVLARELSVREIAKIHEQTAMPLEVFVHGALCVAYSGQCLTSESLGGRSANRGADCRTKLFATATTWTWEKCNTCSVRRTWPPMPSSRSCSRPE